jgi:hypothetical protein
VNEIRPESKSVSLLDLEVSSRQAFGGSYRLPKDLVTDLATYRAGQLVLPPHPHWEGEFTDWTADPFNDRNWRFQHHTLRWLTPLRWAAIAGDTEARTEWLKIVKSWAVTNIPAKASPSDFAWRDMVDGNRAIHLTLGAPLVDAEDMWFVELLQYHRDWLMDKNNIVGKNHGLHQHSGLLVLGALLRDQEAIEMATGRMRSQFETTFDAQGANDEGSSTYHQMNMSWWSTAWKRAKLEGIEVPAEVQVRLKLAGRALAHIAQPDGQLPQIGDSKRTKVSVGLSSFTDFVAKGGALGGAPDECTLILDCGYIVSRSGWGVSRALKDESHMLVRFGEDVRSHSHQDRGSVHIYANGQPWLVDSGFHSYQRGIPEVKYLKSREAHNVANLVGVPHDNSAPVELLSSQITDQYHEFVLCDRGFDGYLLFRRIIYFTAADCWIIADSTDADVPIRQVWHLEPGVLSQIRDFGYQLSSPEGNFAVEWIGRNVEFSSLKATKGSLAGWIGTSWKKMEPSERLEATSTNDEKQLITLLGSHHPHPLGLIDSHVNGINSIQLWISRGVKSWQINIESDNVSIHTIEA